MTETREGNVSSRKKHVTIGAIMRGIWVTTQTRTQTVDLTIKVIDSKHKLSENTNGERVQ